MTSMTSAQFADKVIENMSVISREFMKQQAREFYKIKVTLPQLAILEILHRSGESTMSDLAHSMSVTTAAMTGIVDRLVREGYVSRLHDPEDRRVVRIKLTAKGNAAVKTICFHKREMINKVFSALSESERMAYLKILMRIRENLKS